MLELSIFDDGVVVRVDGDIEASSVSRLRDVLSWAADHHSGVLVDLEDVSTISPAALGVLIRAHTRARSRGGVLCLVAPSRYVLTVLHTMHVDGVFPTFADQAVAFSWLRHGDLNSTPALEQVLASTTS